MLTKEKEKRGVAERSKKLMMLED
jgi:hypothetical protein